MGHLERKMDAKKGQSTVLFFGKSKLKYITLLIMWKKIICCILYSWQIIFVYSNGKLYFNNLKYTTN